ncbi:MAG: glycogen debranching protein [Bacteroidales bacterium]|nr:glycogen debranching protein [Bacteroidales bacterium]
MKKTAFYLGLALVCSCQNSGVIYENDSYSMYTDRIVQGEYTGVAETPCRIVSNLDGEEYVWEKKNDFSGYPSIETPYLIEEAAYNIGLDESINAVEPDGTLRTGVEWGGVWTRDVSYSIIHSMSFIQTEAAKTSLMCKVNSKGEIIQDTGTGGAWPCSTDREIWVGAAWEIYKVTGDMEWLKTVYPIAKKSLEVDMRTVFEPQTNLMRGESSFIDWREQSYPTWMEPADIYDTKCLGTNMVFYIALTSAAEMGRILGDISAAEAFEAQASLIKEGINEHLWMDDCGYYAQYLGGRTDDLLYTKSETLGQALSILWGVAEGERAVRLSENMPVVDFGAPVFWPWIPDQPPYHNQAVWPWVQAYWIHASAKTGNEQGVLHGVGSVWRAAMMYATNKENFVADTGNWKGTQINSSNMLWCLAGNLSITFKLLMGMEFQADAIRFAPFVPRNLKADRTVRNFRYRNSTLDITVSGYGDSIRKFMLDGVKMDDAVVPGDLEGHHTVEIELSDSFQNDRDVNYQPACWTPLMPVTTLDGNTLRWNEVEGADHYEVYVAGENAARTDQTFFDLEDGMSGDVQVVAVASDGTPSFPSAPVNISEKVCKGFPEIMLTRKNAKDFTVTVDVPQAGEWYVSWNYANGTGPVNTDNNCGIRMLYVDGVKAGINIFPHRGTDDWNNWGWTIPEKLSLSEGAHTFTLKYESDADNMDLEINDFKIREICLIAK